MSGGDPIDLTNCDREPIHIPGAIQPHGALFALDAATERVLAASENAAQFTGVPLEQTLNAFASDVFGAETGDAIRIAATRVAVSNAAASFVLPGRDLAALVHRVDDTVFVEVESRASDASSVLAKARDAAAAFGSGDDLDALTAAGAEAVRALTGYDRVMIYRFDPDGHGQVVAESREPFLEAFLGRHYPASDIPRQARVLYKTTMLRVIADIEYAPVPIVPTLDPRDGSPWQLGRASLRSVSPIHVQYLRNMGVAATMTLSLLRAGELWGLIACHHYSPKFADYDMRSAAEAVGYAFVSRIAQLEDARIADARVAVRDAALAFAVRAQADLLGALVDDAPLRTALGIAGMARVDLHGAVIASGGVTPAAAQISAIAAWIGERSGDGDFVTDALAKLNPDFTDLAPDASGVYARRIGDQLLLAFRGEQRLVVDWGGDPTKPVERDGERLSPRGSFALWREEVRLRAMPWEPWTIEFLDLLAGRLLERGIG